MDDDRKRQRDIVGEDIAAKLSAIQESLTDVPKINGHLVRIDHRLDRLEGNMTSVRIIVQEHSAILREHSTDLTEIKADLTEIKHFVGSHEERLVALESRPA